MKCEALTYSAYAADYSTVYSSASSIMGRSSSLATAGEPPCAEGLSFGLSVSLSLAMLRLWLWASFQITGCVDKAKAAIVSALPKTRTFELPCSDPNAVPISIKVNRSMLRKLKRLERLGGARAFETLPHEQAAIAHLSPAQYLEYMIRHHKWSRAKVYGLGPSRREVAREAMTAAVLHGSTARLDQAELCGAPMFPD